MGELSLVRRHVDVHRAVRQTSLARQTQIERVPYFGRPPAVGDQIALEHLPEQMRATPGRVELLLGHLVTRAHHATRTLPALADPDTAPLRLGETVLIVAISKHGEEFAIL